jgi:hypothetical protein
MTTAKKRKPGKRAATAPKPKREASDPSEKYLLYQAQQDVAYLCKSADRALRVAGLPVPMSEHQLQHFAAGDAIDHLARTCASALRTVREQAAEIERLKALDASAARSIDQAVSDMLAPHSTSRPFGSDDPYCAQHVVVVTRDPGGGLWATLGVARGDTVLPYRRARSGGETIHEALASLAFDINLRHASGIGGMCDGLRALNNTPVPA